MKDVPPPAGVIDLRIAPSADVFQSPSPAKMWIQGLDLLRKPLLHLHTQANQSLPWATIDMDFMNLNQAAHGDREYAHAVARVGLPHKIVVGEPASKDVHSHIDAWSWATIGWNKSQNLRWTRTEVICVIFHK